MVPRRSMTVRDVLVPILLQLEVVGMRTQQERVELYNEAKKFWETYPGFAQTNDSNRSRLVLIIMEHLYDEFNNRIDSAKCISLYQRIVYCGLDNEEVKLVSERTVLNFYPLHYYEVIDRARL